MTEQFDGELFPWEDEPAEPQPAVSPIEAEPQSEPERTSGEDERRPPQTGAGEPQTTAAEPVRTEPDRTEPEVAPSPRDSPEQVASADYEAPDEEAARVQAPDSRAAPAEPAAAAPAAPAEPAAAAPAAPAARTEAPARPLVRKEYYSISEVSDLVGLPAHVLRYWESQFSVLNPSKNRSGNRVYQRKEIKLILLVKQLLHEEKYTVEGAKQKLDQLRRGGGIGDATQHALDEQMVRVLRDDLLALSELLRVEGE